MKKLETENTAGPDPAGNLPEISVIVPVYRVEEYLDACIDSILAQTFTDFELILVDDGSPDNCPAMCDAAAAQDDRIRVAHKLNGGLSSARNAGLDIAQGNWIAFVDSDDVVTPDFCEKLHRAAQDTGAGMAVCNYQNVDEQLVPLEEQHLDVRHGVMTTAQALEHCTSGPYMMVCNKLFRKSIFDGLRFAEGKLYEDTMLLPAAYEKAGTIANIPDVLYLYRRVSGSITNSKVTLRTLDRVEASYIWFECARRYGVNACLEELYWAIRCARTDIEKQLTKEERRSPRMKEAKGYERRVWKALWQERAASLWTKIRNTDKNEDRNDTKT